MDGQNKEQEPVCIEKRANATEKMMAPKKKSCRWEKRTWGKLVLMTSQNSKEAAGMGWLERTWRSGYRGNVGQSVWTGMKSKDGKNGGAADAGAVGGMDREVGEWTDGPDHYKRQKVLEAFSALREKGAMKVQRNCEIRGAKGTRKGWGGASQLSVLQSREGKIPAVEAGRGEE